MKRNVLIVDRRGERIVRLISLVTVLCGLAATVVTVRADDACSSPYICSSGTPGPRLVFANVRTLMMESTPAGQQPLTPQLSNHPTTAK